MSNTSSPATGTRDSIIRVSVSLFARTGYDGVSMRDIAKHVGISAATLYHHFPNKEALYLGAIAGAFADKAQAISETAGAGATPRARLEAFVDRFTSLMAKDPDFRLLLQRELIDGDETRLRMVAEQVFREPFTIISSLSRELDPDCDPHMLAISMAGLILFHLETAPVRRFLPGMRKEHDSPATVAAHVKRLLSRALLLTE